MSMMNVSQNSSVVGERLETMHELMEEVLNLQKSGSSSRDVVSRVKKILDESEKVVESSRGAPELVIDGKILNAGGLIVRQEVQNFDAALKTFDPEEYTGGVYEYMEDIGQRDFDWDIIENETYGIFKRMAPLDYMLGTFKLDPPPPPEKPKSQRQKKTADATKSVVSSIDKTDASTEVTDEIYQHILKCLVRCYKENKRQPICYFSFVIDPSDFWVTVQNIFHFSFLVRDNKVKMSLDDRGLPVCEPLLPKDKNENTASSGKNSQFNFRITPFEHRKLIESFDIRKASISPLVISKS